MKKALFISAIFFLPLTVAAFSWSDVFPQLQMFGGPGGGPGGGSGATWIPTGGNLTPFDATYGIKVPSLASKDCIGTDSNGVFQTGTCTGGSGGTSFSTTSANYWASLGNGFSTTSANYWSSHGLGFSTTSASYFASLGLAFSTTTSNYWKSLYSEWSIQNGALSPTTTLGIGVYASSTIGGGTQATGLTVSGTATSTRQVVTARGSIPAPSFSIGSLGAGLAGGASGELYLVSGGEGLEWNGTAFYPTTDSSIDLGGTSNKWNHGYINYSSTTASSADFFCLTGDTCIATWPTGSGSSFSTTSANYWASLGLGFSTTSSNYWKSLYGDWTISNGALSPTTTLGIGVYASSTIGNGSLGLTTNGSATTTGNFYLPALSAGGLALDASKKVYSAATTTAGTGLTYTGSAFNCDTASGSTFGCLSSSDWTTFNNKQAAGNYITALTGDVTASGPGSVAATLATVNSDVGSFTNANITVNAKGLITAASNGSAGSSFSTTSANYWASLGNGFSTTSSNYWASLGNGFSTTSAGYWAGLGLAFSTTSANAWSAKGLGFSTTSAGVWAGLGNAFSTTSANAWSAKGLGFSTTSQNAYQALYRDWSLTNSTTLSPTSTTVGIGVFASSTLGGGGIANGVTIFGSATTTGSSTTTQKLYAGTASTTALFLATGACTGSNALNISTAGQVVCGAVSGSGSSFSTTSANYWASLGNGFSTTSSNYWSSLGNGFSTTSTDFWSSLGRGFSTTSSNYWASLGNAFSTTTSNYWKSLYGDWGISSGALSPTTTLGIGVYASSTIGNGTLGLTVTGNSTTTGNFYLPALGTAAGTFLAADPNGKVIATTTPTGSAASLTATYVGYGSGSNLLTGDSNFTWDSSGQILTIIGELNATTPDENTAFHAESTNGIQLYAVNGIKFTTNGSYLSVDTGALTTDRAWNIADLAGSPALGSYTTGFLNGSIPFGASGLLATSSALTFNNTGSLFTTTNASTTRLTASNYLNIPASADPTVAFTGDFAINTTQASSSVRYYDGTAERVLNAIYTKSTGPVASSTLAYIGSFSQTGTTSLLYMNALHPFTVVSMSCKTDANTAYVQVSDGTNLGTIVPCSTSGTLTTIATNGSFTEGEDFKVNFGSRSATSPNTITVSMNLRDDAD